MVNFETFLLGASVVSIITGLVTEAIKKILTEHIITYHANTLAGLIATVLSAVIGVGYIVLVGAGFTSKTIIYLIMLVFISWLCSMVGYDKVIQTIKQFKMDGKVDKNE